jgi:hypothetical protein
VKNCHVLRPAALAWYIAESALRIRVATSAPWSGYRQMPIDGEMCSSLPSNGNGADSTSMIFSATLLQSSSPATPGTSTTNSSPPSLATVSLARTARHRRLATSLSR